MSDSILWWSGVALWVSLAGFGAPLLLGLAIEAVCKNRELRKEFLAFVLERALAKRAQREAEGED